MTTRSAAAFAIVLLGAACAGGDRAKEPPRGQPSAETAVTSDLLVREHALRGAIVRDAVERGDLKRTKAAANDLVAFVMQYGAPQPESRLEAMVESARRVAAAQDMRDAAQSFALLAERCGECHVQIGGPASFPAKPPPEALGVVPRMRRHQWASARLWEGLVAPSDEAWKSGAEVISDAPLGPESWPGQTTSPELDALAASVHDLGVKATSATKASARIAIYGEVLTTCAGCHQRFRPAR